MLSKQNADIWSIRRQIYQLFAFVRTKVLLHAPIQLYIGDKNARLCCNVATKLKKLSNYEAGVWMSRSINND